MTITFANKKLEKTCLVADMARKAYGSEMAVKINQRVAELMAPANVDELLRCSVGRCHPLQGKRKNCLALDLVQPYRLVIRKTGDDSVQILEIVDYH